MRAVLGGDLGRAVGRPVVDDDHLAACGPSARCPRSAWSTTAPTASSSFRQGTTTEISGAARTSRTALDRSMRARRGRRRAGVGWRGGGPGRHGRARRSRRRAVRGEPARASAVFAVALAVYAVVSVALPLLAGRDLPRYLLDYAQLSHAHVVFPVRDPRTDAGNAVVTGLLLDAGPFASEVGAAVLYALSILAWFSSRRRFGSVAALATAAALLAYPGYVLLFHELASDALFAAAFALVALLLARLVERPTARSRGRTRARSRGARLRPAGRPGARAPRARPLLAARGVRPRLAARGLRRRRARTARSPSPPTTPLRADDFTVVRGGSASLLFRTFVADRIVEPGNGKASEELADAVAQGSSRTSRTDRAGSTSRRSSRRAARGCTTTSPCSPTGRGAGMTTTVISAASPERRSARIPAHTRGASRATSGGCCSGRCTPWSRRFPRFGASYARSPARQRRTAASQPSRRRADDEPIPSSRQRRRIHLDARRADPRGVDVADRPRVRLPDPGRPRAARPRSTGAGQLLDRLPDAPSSPGSSSSSTTSRGSIRGRSCGCCSGSCARRSGAGRAASRSRPRSPASALLVHRSPRRSRCTRSRSTRSRSCLRSSCCDDRPFGRARLRSRARRLRSRVGHAGSAPRPEG